MCRLVLLTIAFLLIFFAASGLYMMPRLIQQKVEQRMQLKIGTKNFERFTRIPIPLTVKFYLFNVTNGERVLAGLERPHFQEVGPFVFKQWRRREVVDILDHNRKLVYREFKTFYPAAPGEGALEPRAHNVTMVNLPLLTVLSQLAQLEEGSFKRRLATRVVSRLIGQGQERILVSKPANEFLFDGYKVGLLESAHELIGNTLGYHFESPLARNKFGFFYGKNGTWSRRENGELTVFTGRNESMDDFMLVDNWNGQRSLRVWPNNTEAGNRCNEIRGTDGSQFHPGVTRDQQLGIFSPLVCSSLFIRFKEETSARGIPLLRFTTPAEVFAAPKKSARNACYCTVQQPARAPDHGLGRAPRSPPGAGQPLPARPPAGPAGPQASAPRATITNARCYIDGLMDLSLCQRGAPIAASSPHFYNADPMLALAAGLSPRQHAHETTIDIEPTTGAVMRAASRAQLNAYVEQAALEAVDGQLIGRMVPMVAPLLWLEEAAEIDEKSAAEFKGQLLDLVDKVRRSCLYAIALGVALALLTSLHFWYYTCHRTGRQLRASAAAGPPNKRRRLEPLDEGRRRARRPRAHHQRQYELNLRLAAAGDQAAPAPAACDAPSRKALVGRAEAAAGGECAAGCESRRAERQRRRTRRADYELGGDSEDALSERNLIESEWAAAAASETSRSASDNGRPGSPGHQQAAPPGPARKA